MSQQRKRVELLSYAYPDTVKLLVGGKSYTYVASEYLCRKLMYGLQYGSGFKAFNKFRKEAKVYVSSDYDEM